MSYFRQWQRIFDYFSCTERCSKKFYGGCSKHILSLKFQGRRIGPKRWTHSGKANRLVQWYL